MILIFKLYTYNNVLIKNYLNLQNLYSVHKIIISKIKSKNILNYTNLVYDYNQ